MRQYRILSREESRERFESLKKTLGRLPTPNEQRANEPRLKQPDLWDVMKTEPEPL